MHRIAPSEVSALCFGVLTGVLWPAMVPVTSGVVGQLFGVRYLGLLYGVVFPGHQLGLFPAPGGAVGRSGRPAVTTPYRGRQCH